MNARIVTLFRFLGFSSLVTVLLLGTATPAAAQNVWNEPSEDNNWFNDLNWSLGSAPVTGQEVRINNGTVEILFPAAVSRLAGIGYEVNSEGRVKVSGAGSTWTNSANLYVGLSGTGTLIIEDGGTVSNDFGSIGNDIDSEGRVRVSGEGSTWTNTGDLYVGLSGTGALIIEDGGTVSNDFGHIGVEAGSEGRARVSGEGSTWTNAGDLSVGIEGKGTLIIEDGGTVSSEDGIIGYEAGSEGRVRMSGAGAIWENDGYLEVGNYGKGTLIIENGGMVSTADDGYIGDEVGSEGRVRVSGEGSTWTNGGDLYVGRSGTGTLIIEAGGTVSNNKGTIASSPGVESLVKVSGVGSTWINDGDLHVGRHGTGRLIIEDGGEVSVSNGDSSIGAYSGSEGWVRVSGENSTWTNDRELYVGSEGKGTLIIEDGGEVSNTEGYIGYTSGSEGLVRVSGAGSRTNSFLLFVGYSGKGTLIIEDGGEVSNGFGIIGHDIDSEGLVRVSGMGSTWTNEATLVVGRNGSKGTLVIEDGGTVSNTNGSIGHFFGSEGLVKVSGAGSTWTNDGNLLVGRTSAGTLNILNGGKVSASSVSVSQAGTLNIGAAFGEAAQGAGVLDAPTLTSSLQGEGAGPLLHFNHTALVTEPYWFTRDGTSAGTAVVISGDIAVQHSSGHTVLNGNNSHSGGTVIDGGVLYAGHAAALGTGDVTLYGGVLEVGAPGGPKLTLNVGGDLDLVFWSSSPGLHFDLGSVAASDKIAVAGQFGFEAGVINARPDHAGGFGTGTYTLVDAASLADDLDVADLTLGLQAAGYRYALELDAVNFDLLLQVDQEGFYFWDGDGTSGDGVVTGGTGTWTAAGVKWTDAEGSAANAAWADGGVAVFGSTGGTVTVEAPIAVGGMHFTMDGYTITGDAVGLQGVYDAVWDGYVGDFRVREGVTAVIESALTGEGQGLLKNDLGTLVLKGVNTYTGDTVVRFGALELRGGSIGLDGDDLIAGLLAVADLAGSRGNFLITEGGRAGALGTLVGGEAGSHGEVTVESGELLQAVLLLGGEGDGVLHVEGGEVLAGIATLGQGPSGYGRVTVTGEGKFTASELQVGVLGVGEMVVDGGEVLNEVASLGFIEGSRGTVEVKDGTWMITAGDCGCVGDSGILLVGEGGTGILKISGGEVSVQYDTVVGAYFGSEGMVEVSGGRLLTEGLFVGEGGTGKLAVSGDGQVESTYAGIGHEAEGLAKVAGGNWVNSEEIAVGYYGTLAVDKTGVVSAQRVELYGFEESAGTVDLLGTELARGELRTEYVIRQEECEGDGYFGKVNFNGGILTALADGSLLRNFEAGDVELKHGGAFINTNGFDNEITVALQGEGGLTKLGAGILTLKRTMAYEGDTVIEAGVLKLEAEELGDWAELTLTAGRTLSIKGGYDANAEGSLETAHLWVGEGGVLRINGGKVEVDVAYEGYAGPAPLTAGIVVGMNAVGSAHMTWGSVEMRQTPSESSAPNTYSVLFVGYGEGSAVGKGSYFTQSGGTVDLGNSSARVGAAGGMGTYLMEGIASFQTLGSTFIGDASAEGGEGITSGAATGTLSVSDAARFYVGTGMEDLGVQFVVGQGAGSVGHIIQDGEFSKVGIFTRNQMHFGVGGGEATYDLLAGELELYSGKIDGIRFGSGAGSKGTLNQEEGSTLTSYGDNVGFNIGHNGGEGVYNLNGGTATHESVMFVAYGDNSKGTLNISGGSLRVGMLSLGYGQNTTAKVRISGSGVLEVGGYNGIYNYGSDGIEDYDYSGSTVEFKLAGGTIRGVDEDLRTAVAMEFEAGTTSTIDTNGLNATLDGEISGDGALKKKGEGTLELTHANSYTGGTTVAEGALLGSVTGAFGSGEVKIKSAGTVEIGVGMEMDNAVKFAGGGVLVVNGTLLSTSELTGSGGTVKGTGSIEAVFTVGADGPVSVLSPGESPGLLTFETSQVWADGGTFVWEINDAAGTGGDDPGWDLITINGTLDIIASSGGFALELVTLGLDNEAGEMVNFDNHSDYEWTILTTTGGITGFDESDFAIDISGVVNSIVGINRDGKFSLGLSTDEKNLVLTYTKAAPEPSRALLLLLGAAGMLMRRRRRHVG